MGALLASLALAPVAPAEPPGLVARYNLDELVGTTAPDSSGNGLNAVRMGAPAALADGRFGGAFRFGGLKDAFAGDFAALRPSAVTVAAWVRAGSTPGAYQNIIGAGAEACSHASYALYTGDSSSVRFYVWNGSAAPVSPAAPGTIWDGAWHLATGTYDGANVRLFVDAKEVGAGTPVTGPIVYGLPDNRFVIGNYAGNLQDPPACGATAKGFAGDIDEVQVFNRALDAAEITSLMTHPSAGGDPPPPVVPAPAPAARIRARLQMAWVVSSRAVKVTSATLSGVPAGATVRIVCRPCRIKQTLIAKRNTQALVRLRNKRLHRGQTLTVTITKRGLIGRVITRKVKRYGRTRAAVERAARRPFTETVRCIPVGVTTPAKKC